MKTVHRLFLTLLLLISTLLIPSSVLAQEAVSTDNYHAPQNSDNMFLDVGHSAFCLMDGADIFSQQKCLTYQVGQSNGASTNKTPTLVLYDQIPSGGVLGGIGNVMLAMYTSPPISSTEYLASLGQQIGIVSPAYATTSVGGAGAGVIQPILVIWQYIRDISYLGFIIIFLAVGFMIMFRQKINPQTVISVQTALPGLVVGLILVTFSYFISALIIDSAFVGVHLAAGVFVSLESKGAYNFLSPDQIQQLAAYGSIWKLFGDFIFNGNHFSALVGPVKDAFQQIFPLGLLKPSNVVGWLIGGGIGGLIGLIALLVVMIALTIAMFKTLWELIQAYITILITTVISPFIILTSSFPGRGSGLGAWWKTLLANALIFPAVFGAFLFAGFFLGTAVNAAPNKTSSAYLANSTVENPNVLGDSTTDPTNGPCGKPFCGDSNYQDALPLFNGIPVDLLKTILGYGILLAIPGIPKQVKEAFKVKDNPLGATAQAGFSAGYAPVGGTIGVGSRFGANTLWDRGATVAGTPGRGPLSNPRARAWTQRLLHGQRWFNGG